MPTKSKDLKERKTLDDFPAQPGSAGAPLLIEEWFAFKYRHDSVTLHGSCPDHPLNPRKGSVAAERETLRTSPVIGKRGQIVITKSGRHYRLGKPARETDSAESFLADLTELHHPEIRSMFAALSEAGFEVENVHDQSARSVEDIEFIFRLTEHPSPAVNFTLRGVPGPYWVMLSKSEKPGELVPDWSNVPELTAVMEKWHDGYLERSQQGAPT